MGKKLEIGSYFLGAGLLWAGFKFITGSATVSEKGKYDFQSVATRSLRANNPLSVSVSSQLAFEGIDYNRSVPNDKTGVSIPGVDFKKGDKLLFFQTTQLGLNAGAKLLSAPGFKAYYPQFSDRPYFGAGDNSIREIGKFWAGSNVDLDKNGIDDYTDNLFRILKGYIPGIGLLSPIHFLTQGIWVMRALSRMECGTANVAGIPDQMFRVAIESTLGGK